MQHLRYMQKSQTPVKTRKRMHEEMEEPGAFEAPCDAPARNSRPFLVVRRGPVQASQGPPKRQKEKRKPKDGGPCTNCGTTMSSMWRPHNSKCAPLPLPPVPSTARSARFHYCSYLLNWAIVSCFGMCSTELSSMCMCIMHFGTAVASCAECCSWTVQTSLARRAATPAGST